MPDRSNPICKSLREGDVIEQFKVERIEDLPEIDGRAVIFRHTVAGTPLLWLANDDENKSFSITFKTPPADNTGVFHILEHSVLCGSEKYPVKEPFVNLLKSSMQTFLNAMTFSDKTMYPVASTNEKDLLNLMSVYMDAVLNPLLNKKREIFEQEGWHYDVEEAEGQERLITTGVVLNEMRGAMSDPDDVLLAGLNRALFPDTAYGYESGGNPSDIPSLSYEAYTDAHARHYNLSNAKIVLYGDMSLVPELKQLNEEHLALWSHKAAEPNPLETQAPVINLDARVTMNTTEDNASAMVGFVMGSYDDRVTQLACEILSDALMGSNEAPLKKVILDSDLGYDADSFVFDGVLQPYIAFELRGCETGSGQDFLKLLREEFDRLVAEGVPKENIAAALDAADFSLRERDSGYADGVALAISAMGGWLYDDKRATDHLRYEEAMSVLREGLCTSFWEDIVQKVFVDSVHFACCELIPITSGESDPKIAETQSQVSFEEARRQSENLRSAQDRADSPEALESLPKLSIADVGDGKRDPEYVTEEDGHLSWIFHSIPTRGIDYTYHYFPLDEVTWDEIPYVTLLCMLLGKLDTKNYSASQLDMLLESKLGRFGFGTHVAENHETHDFNAYLVVAACAIEENISELTMLPAEIWTNTRFDDIAKIKTMLLQQKLDYEQAFVTSGHAYAMSRALGYTEPRKYLAQHFGGVDYYRFICDLLASWDSSSEHLPERLSEVCRKIFKRGSSLHSFTGSKGNYDTFKSYGGKLKLLEDYSYQSKLIVPEPVFLNEAFVIPSDICFVSKALDSNRSNIKPSGLLQIARQILNYDFLWNEIRVKGGAYGCGIRPGASGEIAYYTYRDPNIDSSLKAMDATADWLDSYNPSPRDFEGFVVSAVATHDSPQRPYQIARRQDFHYLSRLPQDYRETIRKQQVTATIDQVKELASSLRTIAEKGAICVFGNEQAIAGSKANLTPVHLFTDK